MSTPETLYLSWKKASSGFIPPESIQGGKNAAGETLYVARGKHEGGIYPGKARVSRAYIPYGSKEIKLDDGYEILIGRESEVKWIPVKGKFSTNQLGGHVPIRGGREAGGTTLYIAKADMHGGTHCGKTKEGGHATIPYEGNEEYPEDYQVLCLAT